MGLRATTVRISDDLWQLLEEESGRQRISVAQFLRDAALLRLGQIAGRREDPEARMTIEDLAARSVQERRQYDNGAAASVALAEPARLDALQRAGLLDQPMDPTLERLTELVAKVLRVPVVLISLIEPGRQFFASHCGLPEPWSSRRQTALSHSFCQHVVTSRQPFVVSDARQHPAVRDNLAIRDLNVIAYAGVPLVTTDDEVLGSLCAIDNQPRVWLSGELELLHDFAASAMAHVEQRLGANR
jgi:GAF domain-containing protein